MPAWDQILREAQTLGSTFDIIRRRYLADLAQKTGRNIITYYSGWLQKPQLGQHVDFGINDNDKNGFMTAVHGLDRSKGLDLILHTPGGETAATESLVDYLRQMFKDDIRAIIPQLAMSAGTMIACACKNIVMGKQSSLGPIDPQLFGMAAHGVIEEFQRAYEEISVDQNKIPVWQPIIAKYSPTLIGECYKAIEWSNEMVKLWLSTGMFKDETPTDKELKVNRIIDTLGSHSLTKSHARHLSTQGCIDIGLKVNWMESLQENNHALQDAILSIHHATLLTLTQTAAYKIIENHQGKSFILTATMEVVRS